MVLAAGLCGLAVARAQGSAPFQFRFNLSLVNPGNVALGRQQVWLYLPASPTAHLTLAGVETSAPHALERDALLHNVLHINVDELPAYARRVYPLSLTLQASTEAAPQADGKAWLAPQRFIESDQTEIVALARQLAGSSTDQTLQNIYSYVAEKMSYAGYLAEDYGALYAARQLRGDCTEYACLVVALCRANGIAARMVGGYVGAYSQAPKPMDYHNWAEVLLDGRWRVCDAQKRNAMRGDENYIAFRYYTDSAVNGVGLAHRYRAVGGAEVLM
jgi:transglutaminase-like putative cysteine protease